MKLPENFHLSHKASLLLEELRDKAIEYQAICQQAPHIWDGENPEDVRMAKAGCNGKVAVRGGFKTVSPCPLRQLCLETAIATQSHYGVWGGLSAAERKNLRRRG